jgi:hypothetical protein
MKEYPVGSICVILSSDPYWNKRECTIVGGLCIREAVFNGRLEVGEMYKIDLKGCKGEDMVACPESLKLKRFPPDVDAWCNSTMKNLLKPLPNEEIKKLAEEVE